MALFYFALFISVILFLKDEKEMNKLLTAVDMYRNPFKISTFIFIIYMVVFMVPFDSIDLSLIINYAVFYLFVGIILYGVYTNQPVKVLKIVIMLHLLGLFGRIALEWMEWTPLKLFNIFISAAIIPLYIFIIQLILTLKRFSAE